MAYYLISYDLNRAKDYPKLWAALRRCGAVRLLDSVWLGALSQPAAAVRDALLNFVDSDDDVVVIELVCGMQWASHANVGNRGVQFLLTHFPFYSLSTTPPGR